MSTPGDGSNVSLDAAAVLAKLRTFLVGQFGDRMATEVINRCSYEVLVEAQAVELDRLRAASAGTKGTTSG